MKGDARLGAPAGAPLVCAALTKKFGDLTAVNRLDLAVLPGTVLGFIGPNGAGKSTAIRMMLGLSAPTSGAVRLFGQNPLTNAPVRARVGYTPGELRLDGRLTAAETLDSWARLRGGVDDGFRSELVERLAVPTRRRLGSLSTGNRRKVALVGALMSRPDVLVLDEPTIGLDPLIQAEFVALLKEAAASGAAVLLSSHVLGEVEQVADRVAVIREGTIVAEGPTGQLSEEAAQEFRVGFAGKIPDLSPLQNAGQLLSAESPAPGQLTIQWVGPPGPLVQELARHQLRSLVAPEPDLETAFISYYQAGKQSTSPSWDASATKGGRG